MFPILALEAAIAAPPAFIADPVWRRKPTGDDFARFYPDAALRLNLQGRGVVECRVTASGEMSECLVLGETPAGVGFGDATLRLVQSFKMETTTAGGQPAAGRTVRLPVVWALPKMGGPPPMRSESRNPPFASLAPCLGQVAAVTEQDPKAPGAWRAMVYWSLRFQEFYASGYARTSEVEGRARQLRLDAQAGKLEIPKAWDLKACLAQVAKG